MKSNRRTGFVNAASRHRSQIIAVLLATSLMASGSAFATTFTYTVVGGGLDVGHACLSSTGAGLCAPSSTFTVGATYPVSGTVVYDDTAGTIDIDLTLATATMSGSHDGVTDIVFTTTHYVVDDMAVAVAFPGSLYGANATGTVDGSYEQFSGGGSVVANTAFGPISTEYNGISCSGLAGVGLCGLTVGGLGDRDFALDVGTTGSGDSTDFVHTLDFNIVIPEPGTGLLFGLGLIALAGARRR